MPNAVVNNITMAYQRVGSGDPVVLIHGLGSCKEDWERQVDALSAEYELLIPDVRGHGQSTKAPGPYSLSQMAGDLEALTDQLFGDRPVHVVGISMGGMLAFQWASDQPDRVRSLTIINSGPAFRVDSWSQRARVMQRLLLFRLLPMPRIGRVVAGRLFPAPDQAALREEFVGRFATNDRDSYLAATRAILGFDVEDRAARLTTPVLAISGDRDYTPVSAKEQYVARLQDARLAVVANSGHASPVDQPDEVNRLIRDFLAEVSAR